MSSHSFTIPRIAKFVSHFVKQVLKVSGYLHNIPSINAQSYSSGRLLLYLTEFIPGEIENYFAPFVTCVVLQVLYQTLSQETRSFWVNTSLISSYLQIRHEIIIINMVIIIKFLGIDKSNGNIL